MPRSLLVADGDLTLSNRLKLVAGDLGMQIETANNGVECVRRLRQRKPDLVLLNIDLLWGGGHGVLAYLREEYAHRAPPVLLMGSTPAQKIPSLVSPPAIQYLSKPFTLSTLMAAIRAAESFVCPGSVPFS